MFKSRWFYDILDDKIVEAKTITEEYCYLQSPQSYDGPFRNKEDVEKYLKKYPNLSKDLNKALEEMRPYYETNYI